MRTHNTYIFTNKKPVAFARSANKYSSQGVDYHTGRDSNCPWLSRYLFPLFTMTQYIQMSLNAF